MFAADGAHSTARHALDIASVLDLAPEARGKVFLLGKWQHDREITDPYRQGKPAFVQAYALIEQAAQAWAQRLAR